MQSSSLSKQVLLLANRVVQDYQIEAVTKDTSYVPPVALHVQSMSKTALFLFTEPTVNTDFTLEAIGSYYVPAPSAISAHSIGATALLLSNATLRNYQLEAIGSDGSFVRPGQIRTRSVAKTALVLAPLQAHTSGYALEALGRGVTPTPSTQYLLEAISGLPYSTPSSDFHLEAVGASTIDPPRPQTEIVWFTIGDP